MSLLGRVKDMLGFRSAPRYEKPSGTRDVISRDVSVALQRQEMASERARAVLEEIKRDRMAETFKGIVGKM